MATRPKAKSDLKIAQGKQRDAYFDRLRRQSQPRKAAPAASAPVAAPAATPAPPSSTALAEPATAPVAEPAAQQ